jgi:recombination protein RecA
VGQGRENSKQFLRENLDLADEIEGKLREKLGLTKPHLAAVEAPAEAPAAAEAS